MLVLESERQGPLGALIAAVNAVEEQLQLLGRGGGGRLGAGWVAGPVGLENGTLC